MGLRSALRRATRWVPALVLAAVATASPTFAGGIIVVPPPEYTFRVGNAAVAVGTFFELPVEFDIVGAEAYSWNINVCHDPFSLVVHDLQEGADLAAIVPDFSIYEIAGNGWNHAVITNIGWVDFAECLPVGADQEIVVATYEKLSAGTSTVCFCDGAALIGPGPYGPIYANRCATPPTEVTDITLECGVVTDPFVLLSLYVRGDANLDAIHDIADAIATINVLFGGLGGSFACEDAADSNDDGFINVADAIYTLAYFFADGPEPPAPYPGCGGDPTNDGLGCGPLVCP